MNLVPAEDKSYIIGDPSMSWILDVSTAQTPSCGYVQTLNVTRSPSFVTSNIGGQNISFSTATRNLEDAGEHIIEITSTLNDASGTSKT